MKNYFNSKKGFTLIELLVVIAILAILAIVGFAAYRGLTGKGNDSRREGDLKAIGDALELSKSSTTGYYIGLQDAQFASGKVPYDPSTVRSYCITYTTVASPTFPANLPAAWTAAGCPAAGTNNDFGTAGGNTGWTPVAINQPTGNVTAWRVCATLDNAVNGSSVICRNSAQ